jgi:hypothetical protein
MMTENIINFNDKVLDKFINHKDSKMKVTHKYNTKLSIKLVDVIFIICIKN